MAALDAFVLLSQDELDEKEGPTTPREYAR
jgi:hypothetical protein